MFEPESGDLNVLRVPTIDFNALHRNALTAKSANPQNYSGMRKAAKIFCSHCVCSHSLIPGGVNGLKKRMG